MLRYIEFCAGAGGMRAGLDAAGWECRLAVDHDADAVAVHRLAHQSAVEADIAELQPEDLPQADVWVAGFPCQPFSSSGRRLGFGHLSGNVFEHLARLLEQRNPPLVVLENVEGLLSNKSGHTFAVVLSKLTAAGYEVDWLLMDLRWFGPPQTRPRLFLIAAHPGVLNSPFLPDGNGLLPGFAEGCRNAFSPLLRSAGIRWAKCSQGSLRTTEELLRPAVGKPRPAGRMPFGRLGHATGDTYLSYEVLSFPDPAPSPELCSIVAPTLKNGEGIRSGRYYARGGPTKLYLRAEPISHCVGTSLGGAPLYALPLALLKRTADRDAFLEHANWHREDDGLLVMRLRPAQAALLFGPHTSALKEAFEHWAAGETRKYKLLGNMVAPVCARTVAELISSEIFFQVDADRKRPTGSVSALTET